MNNITKLIIVASAILLSIVIGYLIMHKSASVTAQHTFPSTTFPSTTFPSTTFPATTFPATTFPATTFPATTFPATTQAPKNLGPMLPNGSIMNLTTDILQSANKKYVARFDGHNIVIINVDGSAQPFITPIGTAESTAATLGMQIDGNLVLFSDGGVPLWNAHSEGQGEGEVLFLQDDGKLCLYNTINAGIFTCYGA